MMIRCLPITICFFFFLPLMAQDFKGSEDHPLIQRYEGSRISSYETISFAATNEANLG